MGLLEDVCSMLVRFLMNMYLAIGFMVLIWFATSLGSINYRYYTYYISCERASVYFLEGPFGALQIYDVAPMSFLKNHQNPFIRSQVRIMLPSERPHYKKKHSEVALSQMTLLFSYQF